ncbi:hypothetical protein [Mesorhizobium sp. SP-1A]|uniref:hypothetical protein n=1 Tax=Mesorhizobium sp. SP-1A TaxID=3077840 RepID=UPI0028F6D632|nr:hypothetical protein [Mesorhizobium sp. SP-1A]
MFNALGGRYEETGLVYRNSMLKQLKIALREQSSGNGQWSRIKAALENTTLGERNDLIMLRRIGNNIDQFGVVGYKEILGKEPRILITPKLAISPIRRGGECNLIVDSLIKEVVSRVVEFRTVVTASKCDKLIVDVRGKGDIAQQIEMGVKATSSISSGVPVFLNGEILESIIDKLGVIEGIESIGKIRSGIGRVLGWPEGDADEEEAFFEAIELAHTTAGIEAMPKERLTDVFQFETSRTSPRHEARCDLKAIADAAVLEKALLASSSNPMAISGLKLMLSDVAAGNSLVMNLWKRDSNALAALLFVNRSIDVSIDEGGNAKIVILYNPNYTQTSNIVMPETIRLVGDAVISQVICDVQTLTSSALKITPTVDVSVAFMPFSNSTNADNDAYYLCDYVSHALEEVDVELPENASFIGAVSLPIASMDLRALFR